ncbi:MAG: hypothetical protein QM689_06815 [Oscillospiraceae bacterium]
MLAFNQRGREILSLAKKNNAALISASLKELSDASPENARLAQLDVLSARLFELSASPAPHEFTRQVRLVLPF